MTNLPVRCYSDSENGIEGEEIRFAADREGRVWWKRPALSGGLYHSGAARDDRDGTLPLQRTQATARFVP